MALQVPGRLGREIFPLQEVISAKLLAMVEDQAVHKFIVHSGNFVNITEALLVSLTVNMPTCDDGWLIMQLWVFTPDLKYSTSTSISRRAMKIFYKTIPEPAKKLEDDIEVGELELPNLAIEQLHTDLKTSTNILPSQAQHHQDWTIGLLDR